MVAAAELAGFWQRGIKVAAPRGRVLARTQTFGLRRVQNSLNPPSHARSGFWFDLPNRSQTSENACGVHPINRKMPDWSDNRTRPFCAIADDAWCSKTPLLIRSRRASA